MLTMADELLRACRAAAGRGADFPAVWGSVLRGHHFVAGLSVQSIVAGSPVLQVPPAKPFPVATVGGANTRSYATS